MKKSVQTGKYIVPDLIASSVVWLLFNLMHYEEVAVYEGFDTVGAFLLHIPSLKGRLLIPFFWFVLYWFSGYYNKPPGKSRFTELFSTLGSVSIGVVILFFALVLNGLPCSYHVYYDMFFPLWESQFVLTYIPQLLITQAGLRKIECREWALNVLMIRAGKKAACIADDLYGLGYNIVGFVSDGTEKKGGVTGDRVISRLESLPVIVEEKKVDELVVALETVDSNRLMDILYSLYCYKRPIKILADKSSSLPQIKIKAIKGIPPVDVTDSNFLPIEQNVELFMGKTLSLTFLVLLSPLFLYITWRVRRDSPGPVFLSQERVGYTSEPFVIYKFRTMYTNAEEGGPLLSSEDNSRITPLGRVMRKYRLDELPQFWNVLKGDMSLVGLRPGCEYFIERIVRKAPFYYLLHNVHPGITLLGTVKYEYAGSVDKMIERLECDILYYEDMSLILDITILIYTVKTVFTGKGV